MSKFPTWFNKAYKRWIRSQAGEEDFLAFCNLLGSSPTKVMEWLRGELVPEGPEVLSIAGTLGINVYEVLDLQKPDPELLRIYRTFSNLSGDYRSKLAYALWEANSEMLKKRITLKSDEAKFILTKSFKKWGFEKNNI